MEEITCPLCGANHTHLLFVGCDEWFGLPGEFPVCKCRQCGLIYLNPRPTPETIGGYYPAQYTPYLPAIADEPTLWRRWNRRYAMSKRVQLVQAHVSPPGRVLDVGCATGNFLAALREAGWQVQGVETNEGAAAYGRQRLDLDIFTGTLEEAHFPDHTFDLVIFWDVLEHVHQPRQALQEALRITKPGGHLLLSLPNPDSFEANWFGRHWGGWDIPRHLCVFPQSTLPHLFNKTGWQMEDLVCATGRMWLFNLSLDHWANAHLKSPRLRQLLMRVSRSLPAQLVALPYFMVAENLKKGSIMAIFARRSSL